MSSVFQIGRPPNRACYESGGLGCSKSGGLGACSESGGSGVPNREGSPFFEAAVAAALALATRPATLGEAVDDRSAKIKSVGEAARMAALRGDTCQIRKDHTR